MSDEPIFCTHCGQESCVCPSRDVTYDDGEGPFCEVCGVIPLEGKSCAETHRPCEPDSVAHALLEEGTGDIQSYEVAASDLEKLDDLMSDENRALGFAGISGGALLSILIAFITAPPSTPNAWAVYLSVTICSFAVTAWFSTLWFSAKRKRPRLLAHIRGKHRRW